MSTITFVPPDLLGDQGVTEDGVDIPATMTLIPTNSDANTASAVPTTTTATNISHQATTRSTATTEAAANVTIVSATSGKIRTTVTASREYLCNPDKPVYLVKIGKKKQQQKTIFMLCIILPNIFSVICMHNLENVQKF